MTSPILRIPHEAFDELRFDRPEALNTLTLDVIEAFDTALADIAASRVRALLITGAGKAFMAGGDLGYLAKAGDAAPAEAFKVIEALNRAMLRLTALDCPTVVAVQGAVAGAGLSLMLNCDIAIATADARFVFAYDRIAATPDGGLSWTLPRAIGHRRAMEIALAGAPVGADRALEIGLVSAVVPAEALRSEAEARAARLGAGPSRAFAATRRLMHDGWDRGFADHLVAERDSFCDRAATEEFHEAVDAFFARRTPAYRSR